MEATKTKPDASKYFKSDFLEKMDSNFIYNDDISDFKNKIKSDVNSAYVQVTSSEKNSHKSILLLISLQPEERWKGKLIQNTKYGFFRIGQEGLVEKISGTLPKMKSFYANSQEDAISRINDYLSGKQSYAEGGNLHLPYHPASSDICESLDTVVPIAMAPESRKFNDSLRVNILLKYGISVEEYVAMKLHYNSVSELCYDPYEKNADGSPKPRFSIEQIDAVATGIFNYEEKNVGLIVADQTGIGKGRTAAGLIRYAILELRKKPIFMTEKKHLFNDIYRDLVDIGFEANVPIEFRPGSDTAIYQDEWSDEEIKKIIAKEIKSGGEEGDLVTIDYSWPLEITPEDVVKYLKTDKSAKEDEIEDILPEVIELMRAKLIEEGYVDYTRWVKRDIVDIEKDLEIARKQGRYRIKPFLLSNIAIVNSKGHLLYPRLKPAVINENLGYDFDGKYNYSNPPILNTKSFNQDFDLICIAYDDIKLRFESDRRTGMPGRQFVNPKTAFALTYANDNIIIADEAHSASGSSSNTFLTVSEMISVASDTIYLSATFAKREDNMPLYALQTSVKETGLGTDDMINAFRAGGDALKEAVSAELTRNGQLIRRDRKVTGTIEYLTAMNEANDQFKGYAQKDKLDRVSELYWRIYELNREFRKYVGDYRRLLPERQAGESLNGKKEEIGKSQSQVAQTFNVFQYFLLALKTDMTVKEALNRLRNGRKLVISVALTSESFLSNVSRTFKSDKENDKYSNGDVIQNDFKLILANFLFGVMFWKQTSESVDDTGTIAPSKRDICVFDDTHRLSILLRGEFQRRYDNILSEILSMDTNLPISPIDVIASAIRNEGFTVEELTGRTKQITFDNGADFSSGTIGKRKKVDKTEAIRDFQENRIDCFIINQSAAVGVSMQSAPMGQANIVYPIVETETEIDGSIMKVESGWPLSLDNKNEVKKRAMIITQMELDINKEVQKLGRISRTGQVYPPEYVYLTSVIPSESRITSMMQRKLKSLMSITSASSEQGASLFTYDDFFGRTAIAAFNETLKDIPELFTYMPKGKTEVETGEDIRNFTKSLYFIPYALQKDFYDTFTRRLQERKDNEIATGTYVDKLAIKDYKTIVLDEFPYYIGNNNSKTSFGRHSVLQKTQVTVFAVKNNQYIVQKEIVDNLKIEFEEKEDSGSINRISRNYSTIEKYKPEALQLLRKIQDDKYKSINTEISNSQQIIDSAIIQLEEAKKSQILLGDDFINAVNLETEIKELNKKIDEKKSEMSDAISQNNFTNIGKIGEEVNILVQEMTTKNESLEKYGDISDKKFTNRQIITNIKENTEKIEFHTRKIKQGEDEKISFDGRINETVKYVELIGKSSTYSELKQNAIQGTSTDGDMFIEKYEYDTTFSEPSVVVGVSFPSNFREFTLSEVKVKIVSVTSKFNIALSSIVGSGISEANKNKGQKPTNNFAGFTVFNFDKDKYWDDLIKGIYTGADTEKWFIRGSILKTYHLATSNNHQGTILKYTTSDGQEKLGIEIRNIIKEGASGKTSTYQNLAQRYNRELAMNYPVLFDGNMFNYQTLMLDYINWFYSERFYEFRESQASLDVFKQFGENQEARRLLFQISLPSGVSVVEIVPNQSLIDYTSRQSMAVMQNHTLATLDKWEPSTILDNVNFVFKTTSTNYMKAMLGLVSSIDESILRDRVVLNNNLEDYSEIRVTNQAERINLNGNRFFFQDLITDTEKTIEIISNNGGRIDVLGKIILTHGEFTSVIEAMESQNAKFTFAIPSSFYEKQSSNFVLQEYIDETISDISQTPEGDVIVISNDEKVNKAIDELVESLIKL